MVTFHCRRKGGILFVVWAAESAGRDACRRAGAVEVPTSRQAPCRMQVAGVQEVVAHLNVSKLALDDLLII